MIGKILFNKGRVAKLNSVIYDNQPDLLISIPLWFSDIENKPKLEYYAVNYIFNGTPSMTDKVLSIKTILRPVVVDYFAKKHITYKSIDISLYGDLNIVYAHIFVTLNDVCKNQERDVFQKHFQ
jgi:hypothetical protein